VEDEYGVVIEVTSRQVRSTVRRGSHGDVAGRAPPCTKRQGSASHSAAWAHKKKWNRMEVKMNFVVAFILCADRGPTVRNELQRARGQDHFVEHPKRERQKNVGLCRGY
jgi:hypothetical protein